jgi:hypothetical protein
MFSINSAQQKVKKQIQATQQRNEGQPPAILLGGTVAKTIFQGIATNYANAPQQVGSSL